MLYLTTLIVIDINIKYTQPQPFFREQKTSFKRPIFASQRSTQPKGFVGFSLYIVSSVLFYIILVIVVSILNFTK